MIAFVLSGGASLGAIQAGMLRALYERRIAPELIVGTSAGALNGGFIATRPPTVETAQALAEVWRRTRTLQVFPPNPITAGLALLGQRDGLVPNFGVKAIVREHVQVKRLEEAPIPLSLIATDIRAGLEVRLSRGDAMSAVLASAAIPGVFPSIEIDGRKLVDGGVCDNTAIDDAAELGATRIYVLPTGAPCELPAAPKGAIPILVHSLSLLINHRLLDDIEQFSRQAELIVLPPPCPNTVLPSDFSHASQLIEQGYSLASQALDHPDPAGHWTPRAVERLRPRHH